MHEKDHHWYTMVKKLIKKQSSNAVLLTNTIIFHKNAGFKSLVEIHKVFCKNKIYNLYANEIDRVSVMCEKCRR